jgi:hypothetical protein
MQRSSATVRTLSGLSLALLVGVLTGAATQRAAAELVQPAASEMKSRPPDPNKKNAGDPCKSADECQAHHTCEKVGSQQVCKAPPPRAVPTVT